MSWRIPLLVCASFAVYAINLDDYFLADDFDLIGSLLRETGVLLFATALRKRVRRRLD